MEDQQTSTRRHAQQRADTSNVTGASAQTEAMSLASVREIMDEEQGYDAPFATFTWRYWLEAQARTIQCFSRFLRAVEENHPDHAIMSVLEMQEITTALLLETYALSANTRLADLPAELSQRLHL